METLIVFILIFGAIVIVHEFGHFYFAKRAGVLVREFSIGMGPKLLAKRYHETTYTLRLLPLGGYVRMAGLQDDEEDELKAGTPVSLTLNDKQQVTRINASQKVLLNDGIPFEVANSDLQEALVISGYENGDDSQLKQYHVVHDATIIEKDGTEVQIAPVDVQFQSVSIFKRMLINIAGVMNNFILGILTFILVAFLAGGVARSDSNQIGTIQANSVAQQAGLKSGDRITAVNGQKTADFIAIAQAINQHPKQKVNLTVSQGDAQKKIAVTPKATTNNGKKIGVIGIGVKMDQSFKAKIAHGFTYTWQIFSATLKVLGGMLVHGFDINNFGGPVAMYSLTSQATKMGASTILNLMGLLSISIAIMNLLPIPALDGGKLLLNILEAIRHKPLAPEKEGMITLVGFALMLLLLVAVTWNDFQRFFMR
ncbi:RIP metalloprotease RseP [Loigolactobacillus rennini]|uniref:Zinc metalloprotease n=1 Tax=Loigolactobacillus rennini DSM 20253 TaxID=1423796 RepID=A0A0R2D895_9LACO|nr:RIP metalloprotease RseP [Loigolactobacillus rennini]KRN00121.1 membrane-associated zinc metalloendopeptidase [Loigolactobacillus rennini DSM 20253]